MLKFGLSEKHTLSEFNKILELRIYARLIVLKFIFLRRPQKLTKSSLSIWRYVISVKLTVKISSLFVAFLEHKL